MVATRCIIKNCAAQIYWHVPEIIYIIKTAHKNVALWYTDLSIIMLRFRHSFKCLTALSKLIKLLANSSNRGPELACYGSHGNVLVFTATSK